jgi:hypothetical protein
MIANDQVKHYVQKWFVLTTLTGRYAGSPETVMSRDIRQIEEKGFLNFFEEAERSALADTFWEVTLPQNLETTSVNSPAFNTFLAAQINLNKNSLFMHGTMISDLLNISGDVHHIFPRKYLIRNGITEKNRYNQIANFTYLDTMVNKLISDDAPNIYFQKAANGCADGIAVYGNISDTKTLNNNLKSNCIPESIVSMNADSYNEFLQIRRSLMAEKIKEYYYSL